MNNYLEFLESKKKTHKPTGFEIGLDELPDTLFPFQKFVVKRSLEHGKFAVFSGTGTGKTRQQLVWAKYVLDYTQKPVLILAPLAVSGQTIKEGERIGIEVTRMSGSGIVIANYEQLENIDCSVFGGIALDEASIIKNHEGAYRNLIIENFYNTQFKSVWTATPSPNDPMELGNYSEFLNIMSRSEMLAMYFVHDAGETQKWRLKGHCRKIFWEWVSTWAIMFQNPKDIWFEQDGYDLPPLNLVEKKIFTDKRENGKLFNDVAVSATTFNQELRLTKVARLDEVAAIVNNSTETFLIWVKQNEEGEMLRKLIPDAIEVKGSDSLEQKEFVALWFGNNQNECLCQQKSSEPSIGQHITPNTEIGLKKKTILELKKDANQTQNLESNELNIAQNTISKTKTNSTKAVQINEIKLINEGESDTPPMLITEPTLKIKSRNHGGDTQTGKLQEDSKSTDLQLSNTTLYLQSKKDNAQYAEQNQHLSLKNKDFTLTIATKQELSEDYCAETAIMDLENSMIQKYCSNVQLCTYCGKHKRKVLISKTKILGAGLNYQNCHNQIFASLDFSFESLFQGIRRSWRFGQTQPVNIWMITTDTMTNVIQSIKQKEKQFEEMHAEMTKAVNENLYRNRVIKLNRKFEQFKTDKFMYQLGDSVQLIKNIPDESIGMSIWSPPFPTLYVYSDEIEDMGNSKDFKEFFIGFNFLIPELYRTMISGRNVVVHCMDVPIQKGKEGYIGLRDFSGMIIDSFLKAGFIYHSRVSLWKNPVTEMQRTKALGLLHKQIKKDASMCRVGIPDYLLVFRKAGDNPFPIVHQDTDPAQPNYLPVDLWQKYASPVWMDIDFGDTLNSREAKDEDDERHIAPLALPIINRCLHLWSNENDTILTTYGGIGSEGHEAIKLKRKAILFELKKSYFDEGVKNCLTAEASLKQNTLFNQPV